MERLEGYVDHIIYRNQDNGYTVMNVVSDGEEITCVGTLHYIGEENCLRRAVITREHATYGRQFQIEGLKLKEPEDVLAIERYLGSGAIKGIGVSLAARIVRKFKEDTFRIMEEEPERLAEVKGISERKAREISEQMEEKKDLRKAMIFLQQYGISTALGVKIYSQYGQNIYQIIKENPYQMADDISGIGFRIADENRFPGGDPHRFRLSDPMRNPLLSPAGDAGRPCLSAKGDPDQTRRGAFGSQARRRWTNISWIWRWTES